MSRALDHWVDEKGSAHLYRVLAEVEKGTSRAALLHDLARAAERQSVPWEQAVRHAGETFPAFAPGLRVRIVSLLVRRIAPRRILPRIKVLSCVSRATAKVVWVNLPSVDRPRAA